MSQNYETLLFEIDEQGIGLLTINRPDKLNALNNQVLEELEAAVEQIKKNKDVKGLIITGAGEKAFVAGADISELNTLSAAEAEKASLRGQAVFQAVEELTIPVIAAVNGYALGGGLELAMACHIRIAGKKAVMGLPETGLALIPGYGGTQRLAALTGKAKALEMILSARYVDADEALQIGLVNLIALETARDSAFELMKTILKNGPVALKNAILAVHEAGKPGGYAQEAALFGELFNTDDFKEGTGAFLEKRKPVFTGK